ncbi:hypothetical protein jhhlp_000636 [Lomentospora prolificans]|uniref:AA1-like domain-containing protein n=1 Tax=Lomentospora prolificans TaxID=41688 RepID=A0A2N3NJ20_9PEZI|nr:hypothetical protein jhhlp_000636 [Lomentospora prolificans]
MAVVKSTLIWVAFVVLASAQSPGPDWPRCTITSTTHHPGWEILDLAFLPPDGRYTNASIRFRVQNAADGSRTECNLSRELFADDTAPDADTIVLDNSDGTCTTYWSEREEETPRAITETAQVQFDIASGELTIEQGWVCGDSGSDGIEYTGKATHGFQYGCAVGREGEQTLCQPEDLFIIGAPRIFLGPAKVVATTESSTISYPIGKDEDCDSLPTEFAGWQILSMNFWPPAEQPEGSPYDPVSTRIDLRNLNDGSRTICYLKSDDITNAEDGITLANKGASLGDGNYDNGCVTGWFKLLGGGDEVTQQWEWYSTANITFNTRTYELEISQTWPCGGVDDVFEAYVLQRLNMDCEDTGNSMVPTVCRPKAALYNAGGAPVIVKGVMPDFLRPPSK